MDIAILDGVVIAIIVISALLAMFRGFVREVLSIAAWVAAAVLAYFFYPELVPHVGQYVSNPTLAVAISAAAIFLLALIVVSLITMKISDFVMDSPVGALDRLLGLLFGAARGVLLVVVAVIFFNWLVDDDSRPAWVTDARSYPILTNLGDDLLAAIPDDPEQAIRGAFEGAQEAIEDAADEAGDGTAVEVNPGTVVEESDQNQLDQVIDATEGENPTVIAPEPVEDADPAATQN